jgi:hypothetical protein
MLIGVDHGDESAWFIECQWSYGIQVFIRLMLFETNKQKRRQLSFLLPVSFCCGFLNCQVE